MAKKVFTDESLATFVEEIKSYVGDSVSTKADSSHSHAISDVTNLQTTLDAKQATITGGATTIASSNLTTSRALVSNSSGKVAVSAVTSTELGYLDGVTSNIQTQLDGKAASSHTHAATDIASGTLSSDRLPTVPITKGGTGATTAAAALTNLGITATATELNILDGVTATTTELNYVDGVTSNVQTQLNAKQATITGGATTIASSNLTASRALVSNSSGKVAVSAVTSTELGYLDGVTSNVQTQLDGKAASSHTHTVANISDLTATATELNYMDGVTSNVQTQLDGKSSTSHTHNTTYVPDTRNDNQTPVWYITNYPKQVITEFKYTSVIGLSGATYCELTTYVQWSNSSGGYPSQEAIINGRLYTRYGTADDTWSSWKTNVDSDNISSQSVATSATCTGNAATATKLATARTIGIGTGATGTATSFNGSANITIPVTSVYESYLTWGGKNLAGGVSPIDAACSNIHSANRFAFAKADGITIEYSTDGSTYSDYGSTDAAKVNLVSGIGSTHYIGARSSSTTVNDKLRITLHATNMGLYTRLRKLLINISTNYATGSNVIIEKAMKGSEDTFTTIGTYSISGWSGWNSIPIGSAFGGGSTQTGNIAILRLTFGITGVNSAQTANALSVIDIVGIGDTYWSYPSTMAKTGHIYSYDSSQNATFPAKVTATTFAGALSGNATTATTATKLGSSTVGGAAKPIYLSSGTATACSSTVGGTAKPVYMNAGTITACSSTVGSATQPVYMNAGTVTACTYTLGKSVPSNAVFTDTNTKVTNTLATTTKAYVTGTTSASTNTGTQVFDTGVYLDTTAGQLTATTFNGTTFSGGGVATLAEVQEYLGI